jgi:hypothetical protein
VQGDVHPARLAPARLIRVILGETDLRLRGLAGKERHDPFFQLRDSLVLAQHKIVGLGDTGNAVFDRCHFHPHHVAG